MDYLTVVVLHLPVGKVSLCQALDATLGKLLASKASVKYCPQHEPTHLRCISPAVLLHLRCTGQRSEEHIHFREPILGGMF